MPTLPENSTANWRCRPKPVNGVAKMAAEKRPVNIRRLLPARSCVARGARWSAAPL